MGEQTFIFLTRSMDFLGKLFQDLWRRKPRTSKERDFDITDKTLQYKEVSK